MCMWQVVSDGGCLYGNIVNQYALLAQYDCLYDSSKDQFINTFIDFISWRIISLWTDLEKPEFDNII